MCTIFVYFICTLYFCTIYLVLYILFCIGHCNRSDFYTLFISCFVYPFLYILFLCLVFCVIFFIDNLIHIIPQIEALFCLFMYFIYLLFELEPWIYYIQKSPQPPQRLTIIAGLLVQYTWFIHGLSHILTSGGGVVRQLWLFSGYNYGLYTCYSLGYFLSLPLITTFIEIFFRKKSYNILFFENFL